MKPLHQRIAGHLYSSSRALGLTSIAIALNEPQSKVDAALRTMRKNGELVLNGWSKYRLSDDVRAAMDEAEREPKNEWVEKTGGNRSEPLKLPEVDDSAAAAFADRVAADVVAKSIEDARGEQREGTPENPAATRGTTHGEGFSVPTAEPPTEPTCGDCARIGKRVDSWKMHVCDAWLLPCGEKPWRHEMTPVAIASMNAEPCPLFTRTAKPEVSANLSPPEGTAGQGGIVDPLDPTESVEGVTCEGCGERATRTVLSDEDGILGFCSACWEAIAATELVAGETNETEPTDAELDAVEEEIRDEQDPRPTNGLRIEQVARELVALEDRRRELLEELRGLV